MPPVFLFLLEPVLAAAAAVLDRQFPGRYRNFLFPEQRRLFPEQTGVLLAGEALISAASLFPDTAVPGDRIPDNFLLFPA